MTKNLLVKTNNIKFMEYKNLSGEIMKKIEEGVYHTPEKKDSDMLKDLQELANAKRNENLITDQLPKSEGEEEHEKLKNSLKDVVETTIKLSAKIARAYDEKIDGKVYEFGLVKLQKK